MLEILSGPEAELIKLCRESIRASAKRAEQLRQLQHRIEDAQQKQSRARQRTESFLWNFEHAHEAWLLLSCSGLIECGNRAACELLAVGRDELCASNFLDLLIPSDRHSCLARLKSCARKRQPGVWRARLRNGESLDIRGQCFGSRDPVDVWLRLSIPAVAAQPWPELEEVLRGLRQGILVADNQGRILFQNESAVQLLGADLRGSRLSNLGDYRPRLQVEKLSFGFLVRVLDPSQERYTSARLDEIRESERLGLGRDLEQSFGPIFSKMVDFTVRLARELKGVEPESAMAEQLVRMAEQCRSKSVNMQKGLYPSELDRSGLVGALSDLASTTQGCFGIKCQVQGQELSMGRTTALHLFRVAQEALTNAVRHANPTAIQIQLQFDSQRIWLEIYDNGRGMEVSGPRARGLGLRSMRAHAELMNGGLEVDSRQGCGTRIRCWAPRMSEAPESAPGK